MNARLFQIEFFGGPQDGLSVRSSVFPNRNLLVPAGCSTSRVGQSCSAFTARRARYELAGSRLGVDAENGPVIRLKYDFVEVAWLQPESQAGRFAARLWKTLLLRRSGGWKRNFGEMVKAWMLAPIDYPFRINAEPSPAAPCEVRHSA